MSMIVSRTHILVAETGALSAGLSQVDRHQPPYYMDFSGYRELYWTLSVAAATGSPSSWSLGAKFQFAVANSAGYRFQNPRWYDLQEENVWASVVEGVGWYSGAHPQPIGGEAGIVADQTDTLPVTVSRALVHFPSLVRVVLDPQLDGGTDPGINLTLTVEGKS